MEMGVWLDIIVGPVRIVIGQVACREIVRKDLIDLDHRRSSRETEPNNEIEHTTLHEIFNLDQKHDHKPNIICQVP